MEIMEVTIFRRYSWWASLEVFPSKDLGLTFLKKELDTTFGVIFWYSQITEWKENLGRILR